MKLNILIFCIFLFCSCASIINPDGGDKDISAPLVINTIPDSACTNCKPQSIILEFDEYVQVQNANTEWYINPKNNKNLTHKIINKKLIINGLDSLSENKTYSIFFQNSISDINESNPLRNYRFVFSTGNYIDTCAFKGTIISSLTGLPEKNISIIAQNDHDQYLAISDDSGQYHIQNLPPGSYSFSAFDDKNKNRLDDIDENFGFTFQNAQTCLAEIEPISIFKNISGPQEVLKCISPLPGLFQFILKHPVYYYPVDISYLNQSARILSEDTLQIILPEYADTIGFKYQSSDTSYIISHVTSALPDSLQVSTLTNGKTSHLYFNAIITKLDTSRIHIRDSAGNTLKCIIRSDENKLIINSPVYTSLYINIGDSCIEIPNHKKLPGLKDTIICKLQSTSGKSGLGSLHFNTDSLPNPIFLELISQNRIVQSMYVKRNEKAEFDDLNPGMYQLRIKTDSNGNGYFDKGNKKLKALPEPISVLNKEFKVKPNWIQKDISLE